MPKSSKKTPRRVSLIRKNIPGKSISKKLDIDYLLNIPPEIAQKILLDLPAHDVVKACVINKVFKRKVCNDYFWRQLVDKNWKKTKASLGEGILWSSEHGYSKILKTILKKKCRPVC